jgi:hypothetical protein
MKNKLPLFIGFGLGIIFCLAILVLVDFTPAPDSSSVKELSERDIYCPGTEDLALYEMRVAVLGKGVPIMEHLFRSLRSK